MGLSPSTLFHFTDKKSLKGILQDNFKLKYCLEKISGDQNHGRIAIPMVSFCDIKISEIKEHIEKYGYYGIGLTKKWAIESELSPVFYQNPNSSFSIDVKSKIGDVLLSNPNDGVIDIMFNFLRLSKEYEGVLRRKGKTNKSYRFADEREWRYIPNLNANGLYPNYLHELDYDTQAKKDVANKKLAYERLYFDANEIMYIIVRYDSDIGEIISHINTVKGEKYTMNEIERLKTRIISCERILSDF